jgi:hypothetical protein
MRKQICWQYLKLPWTAQRKPSAVTSDGQRWALA